MNIPDFACSYIYILYQVQRNIVLINFDTEVRVPLLIVKWGKIPCILFLMYVLPLLCQICSFPSLLFQRWLTQHQVTSFSWLENHFDMYTNTENDC